MLSDFDATFRMVRDRWDKPEKDFRKFPIRRLIDSAISDAFCAGVRVGLSHPQVLPS